MLKKIKLNLNNFKDIFAYFFGNSINDNKNLKEGSIIEGLATAYTNRDLILYLKKRMFLAWKGAATAKQMRERDGYLGSIAELDNILAGLKEAFKIINKKKNDD